MTTRAESYPLQPTLATLARLNRRVVVGGESLEPESLSGDSLTILSPFNQRKGTRTCGLGGNRWRTRVCTRGSVASLQ